MHPTFLDSLKYILVMTIFVQTGSKTLANNTSRTRYYSIFQRIKDPLVFRKELASPRNVSANRTYSKSASARVWNDRNLRNQAQPHRRTLYALQEGVVDPEVRSPPLPWQPEPCGANSCCGVQTTLWKERGFLREVKSSVVEGTLKAYPRLIAARQIERMVASNTEYSPSERKTRTGDL